MQQTSRTATPTVTRIANRVLFVVIQCKKLCILPTTLNSDTHRSDELL